MKAKTIKVSLNIGAEIEDLVGEYDITYDIENQEMIITQRNLKEC